MSKKNLFIIISVFLVLYFHVGQENIAPKDTISEVKSRMIKYQKSKAVAEHKVKAESFGNHIYTPIATNNHPEPEMEPENVINEAPIFQNVSLYFENMEEIEDESGQKYVYIPGHEENGARIQIKMKLSEWEKLVGN